MSGLFTCRISCNHAYGGDRCFHIGSEAEPPLVKQRDGALVGGGFDISWSYQISKHSYFMEVVSTLTNFFFLIKNTGAFNFKEFFLWELNPAPRSPRVQQETRETEMSCKVYAGSWPPEREGGIEI